ncbi:hypothetical protein BJ165DRAFT_479792 [Panaeolus papilionaceus]|nr:hypothetical protein BJ165DRAFT_479792 [Panaeolus papilionaceus]
MTSFLNSASSARSFFSPKSGTYPVTDGIQPLSAITPSLQTASYLKSLPSAKLLNDNWDLNPDELFTKFTVVEVRNIQHRLQADADVKQEELRQMVGERYRDLLQASTSIISLAASSRRVLAAIEESKDAISKKNEVLETSQHDESSRADDKQLQALQTLSVHVKLLLDAPEHLWRLIERRKYLSAAWLFLLSRVVHRALVRNEENDDQVWCKEGIDIQVDFPLVQRQWDVVFQFRPQIIHKSTLALRDTSSSTEDICAILVTLNLLDSRPLHETLSTLLSQRSKSLDSALIYPKTGDSSQELAKLNSNPALTVREVTQLMKKSLAAIIQTMTITKDIFEQRDSRLPLLIRVLAAIQSETTGLLPESLRLYKPYIDLDSASAKLSQSQLEKKLNDWLRDSSGRWAKACQEWLFGLKSAKETWIVRGSLWRYILTSSLVTSEKQQLLGILDSLAQKRIVDIWTEILGNAESQFQTALKSITSQIETKSTIDILFQSPPIPMITQSTKHFSDAPFQKYQASLKRQLIGRSAQLEELLSSIENCARVIQNDFLQLKGHDPSASDSKQVVEKFNEIYQPKADKMTTAIATAVKFSASSAIGQAGVSSHMLAFLSQLTDDLLSTSTFISSIATSQAVCQDFKLQIASTRETVTHKWSEVAIDQIMPKSDDRAFSVILREPNGPSTLLSRSLLRLCQQIQSLGVVFSPTKRVDIVRNLFDMFIKAWTGRFKVNYPQATFDLRYLQKIAKLNGWSKSSDILQDALAESDPVMEAPDATKYVEESILRSQTLLCQLLPEPTGVNVESLLLHLGTPSGQSYHHTALDVARPSPRFGLLLTGNMSHQ